MVFDSLLARSEDQGNERRFRPVKPLRKLFLSLDPLRVYPIVASCKVRTAPRSFSLVHLTEAIRRSFSRGTTPLFPGRLWKFLTYNVEEASRKGGAAFHPRRDINFYHFSPFGKAQPIGEATTARSLIAKQSEITKQAYT